MEEAERIEGLQIRNSRVDALNLELSQSKYQTRKKIIDFAKLGEKLSLCGSNCHFCKSVMTVNESNACRTIILKPIELSHKSVKRKSCNKKFCFGCLEKNFPKCYTNRFNKEWHCPCCTGECFCPHCKKQNEKELTRERKFDNDSQIQIEAHSWDDNNKNCLNHFVRESALVNPFSLIKQKSASEDLKVSD